MKCLQCNVQYLAQCGKIPLLFVSSEKKNRNLDFSLVQKDVVNKKKNPNLQIVKIKIRSLIEK